MKKTRSHSKKGLIILIIINSCTVCGDGFKKMQEQTEEYTENKVIT